MNRDNSSLTIRSRAVMLLYKIVMPGLVVILFLGVSSLIKRPILSGSMLLDILARVIVSLWLAVGYYRIPDLAKKYRVNPGIEWKKSDISPAGRLLYMSMAVWLAFGAALVTWWGINVFLADWKDVSLPLALVSGIIYGIPLVSQYQVFKF